MPLGGVPRVNGWSQVARCGVDRFAHAPLAPALATKRRLAGVTTHAVESRGVEGGIRCSPGRRLFLDVGIAWRAPDIGVAYVVRRRRSAFSYDRSRRISPAAQPSHGGAGSTALTLHVLLVRAFGRPRSAATAIAKLV